ncbi:MAG TPA: glutamate-cysteine ligase family protein [Candidatus Limnocylindria bacterium]|nr:glutamate-cysteine ligase family protein [Candidatus Limnocylindria bacterium]
MTDFRASTEAVAIDGIGQLVDALERAGKPPAEWRIGVEHEKIGVDRHSGLAAPFSGPHGIERLLIELSERFAWERVEENGRTIALRRGDLSITLEPGAQVELAGAPRRTLHEARAELVGHLAEITAVGADLGIAFLGLGIQPASTVEQIELVPKERYRVMDPYMLRVGTLGRRMMRQTATVQANIDFSDERDAMLKLRTGLRLAPVMNAIFANSCVVDGTLSDFASFRGYVWTDTDRARCGMPRFAWDDGAGFESYVQWALDVPVYFFLRDGHYTRDVTGIPFRSLLAGVRGLPRPNFDDWHLHLTTLFPEVRLKGFLEFRSTDAQPARTLLAPAAMVKGLFYEADCLGAAWDMVKSWTFDECVELAHTVVRTALGARMRRIPLRELAAELGAIAAEGLRRQDCRDEQGRTEVVYLEPALDLIARGLWPGAATAQRWTDEWQGRMRELVAGSELGTDLP